MALLLCIPGKSYGQLESLVMPGDVIEGHAELETDCNACHLKFKRSEQKRLCLDCHEDVAADIAAASGYHGKNRYAMRKDCATCHTDHEGRDADIVGLNESTFDHDETDFLLSGRHGETPCADCHEPDRKYREAPTDCHACHADDNVHDDFLGEQCGDCHSSSGWDDVEFDHDTTGFALMGKHLEPACLDCHSDQTFQNAPTTCFGCHAEDDAHNGLSGEHCESCHSPQGWGDTSFDHDRDTDFPLDGAHALSECSGCHSNDPFADDLDAVCVDCHREDDAHDGHFGGSCDSCHLTEGWEPVHFNHAEVTGHALDGAHETVECEACHIEPVYDVALEGSCVSCHEEDDAHEGTQGITCGDCHNESSWEDSVFFDHDLTSFPLLGAHADAECESCHETHVFTNAPTDCIGCHAEDDAHRGRFGGTCASCHNPVAWQSWQFDHDTQTGFRLEGAHSDVKCDVCHRQSLGAQRRLGEQCIDCHRADDIHDGEFGPDCSRCHSAGSFREVRTIQ